MEFDIIKIFYIQEMIYIELMNCYYSYQHSAYFEIKRLKNWLLKNITNSYSTIRLKSM